MNEKSSLPNLVNFVLVLATVAWGALTLRSGLSGGRLPQTLLSAPGRAPQASNRVWSRLWQDPFESFFSATNQSGAGVMATSTAAVPEDLQRSQRAGKSAVETTIPELSSRTEHGIEPGGLWKKLTASRPNTNGLIAVLGVMVPGGPYREDQEARQRLRYAVEMALLNDNYGPQDRAHIFTNWVSLAWSGGKNEPAQTRFAYEWFSADARYNVSSSRPAMDRQVCVLWLDEDAFAEHPLLRADRLLSGIFMDVEKMDRGQSLSNVAFYLIGPRTSDTLQSFADQEDAKMAPCLQTLARCGRFHILSPEATSQRRDWQRQGEDLFNSDLVRKIRSTLGPNVFHNWIATDSMLASLVVRELQDRVAGSHIAESSNVVVIITEQDSFYGRTAAIAFAGAFSKASFCGALDHVWQFSFLRGLDGSKPPSDKPPEPSSTLSTTPEAAAFQAVLRKQEQGDKADGDAQLDYLFRLGKFLKNKDEDLRRDGHRIVAVGITLTDVYDKLMLLRSLRENLSEAVFFTTDLEAPLWATDQLNHTRNLLVASSYGLEPDPTDPDPLHNEQFPPFRDSYQMAVLKAVRAAVNQLFVNTNLPPVDVGSLEPAPAERIARVYEIGWHGPVALDIPKTTRSPWLHWVWVGAACGLGIALVFGSLAWGFARPSWKGCTGLEDMRRAKPGSRNSESKPPAECHHSPSVRIWQAERDEAERKVPVDRVLWGAAGGALAGLFLGMAEAVSRVPGEEPWDWTGGISIWPCEFFRFLAALAAVLFLWYAYVLHRQHRKRLWCEYFGKDQDSPEDPLEVRWERFWCLGRHGWWDAFRKGNPSWAEWGRRFLKPFAFGWEARWNSIFPSPSPAIPRWLPNKRSASVAEMLKEESAAPPTRGSPLLLMSWRPLLVDDPTVDVNRASLDAEHLCKDYLRLGLLPVRLMRVGLATLWYFVFTYLLLTESHGFPTFLLIRGGLSHRIDLAMLVIAGIPFLLLLFYVIDSAQITATLLNAISRHPTRWPRNLLREQVARAGVRAEHLDGVLDVAFAAMQTKEVGRLMGAPFVVLLLVLLSYFPFFDDWSWPIGLRVLFLATSVLTVTAWLIVRRVARKVRIDALSNLTDEIKEVEATGDGPVTVALPEGPTPSKHREARSDLPPTERFGALFGPGITRVEVPRKDYLRRLRSLRARIEDERQGAYARWFQDPSYYTIFIPTGITGILAVMAQIWMNRW